MSDAILKDDIHLSNLIGFNFVIPDYQRGYKWQSKDVKYLIKDLVEYKGEKPYYMQPLVVVPKGEKYIIVDGQQRITTFFLIWRRMTECGHFKQYPFEQNNRITLEYENRPDSTKYLSLTNDSSLKVTPDVRNFIRAERAIDDTIKNLSKEEIKHFEDNFFKKATFLWYNLEDPEQGPAMFERLNGKRIALTDIELCKVYLLSDACTATAQRQERAMAWQNMEYRLQENQFFSFISKEYDLFHDRSRMNYLLDISLTKQNKKEELDYIDFPLYNRLKKDTENGNNVWKNIVHVFHRLEQLYDNPLYYNLIGFLINGTSTRLRDILEDVSYEDFDNKLLQRIISWRDEGKDIGKLVYKDSKTYSALLLFNILTDLNVKSEGNKKIEERYSFNNRFRFDLLKIEAYDKEHVHATHSQRLRSAIEWQQWCKTIIKYFPEEKLKLIKKENYDIIRDVAAVRIENETKETEESVKKRLAEEITKIMNASKFEEIFDEVNNLVEEGHEEDDKQNSIGNMALLNKSINRDPAYAAAPFAIKRSIIRERIKEGYFVPKGTQLMFEKGFRAIPQEQYHWAKNKYANGEQSDKDSFIEYLEDTVNKLQV